MELRWVLEIGEPLLARPAAPQFLAAAFDADELRAADRFRQRNAVVDRLNRVRCAVNDEKRCPYIMQPSPPFFS
jgi:hypothetical protein